MRFLGVLLVIVQNLLAYQYNSFYLKTQIDLYPKILLFNKDLKKRIDDGRIDFYILYEGIDKLNAEKVAMKLNEKYQKLDHFRFHARAVNIWSFLSDKYKKADALYILKISNRRCNLIAKKALKRKIVTFVYDLNDLKCGFLIGVDIEREVQIFLNKTALLKGGYDFVGDFYLMVRFLE